MYRQTGETKAKQCEWKELDRQRERLMRKRRLEKALVRKGRQKKRRKQNSVSEKELGRQRYIER